MLKVDLSEELGQCKELMCPFSGVDAWVKNVYNNQVWQKLLFFFQQFQLHPLRAFGSKPK